jgi:UDP-N-acetylglucosamine:LPS N-acetylglucosamine transferase
MIQPKPNMSSEARVVIFAARTGGGHWSPAVAIAEELSRLSEGRVRAEVVDGLYGETGLGYVIEHGYSILIRRARRLWGSFFTLTNKQLTFHFGDAMLRRLMRKQRCTLKDGPLPAAVVCTNSIILSPIARILREDHLDLPYFSVVTDLITVHRAWANQDVDFHFSPTNVAGRSLVHYGISAARIVNTGLPVARSFYPIEPQKKMQVRTELGLDQNRPVALIMHGAEGHTRMLKIAHLLDRKFGSAVEQVVITGKNQDLRRKFEEWGPGGHIKVLGFTTQVSEYMKACDVLVTKAGSLTVSEALACGKPLIISESLPGQESGTVEWLTSKGAASSAPSAQEVAVQIAYLLSHPGSKLPHRANFLIRLFLLGGKLFLWI